MPADLLQRINLDLLYAPFRDTLLDVLADCRVAGQDYTATSGFRSWNDQNKLYFQGRTMAGPIVTNARGGESAHNFGIAVDLYAGNWNTGDYQLLGKMAQLRGLVWGGAWKHPDFPHVQLAGYVTSNDLAPLRDAWQGCEGDDLTRLRAVWHYLDSTRATF